MRQISSNVQSLSPRALCSVCPACVHCCFMQMQDFQIPKRPQFVFPRAHCTLLMYICTDVLMYCTTFLTIMSIIKQYCRNTVQCNSLKYRTGLSNAVQCKFVQCCLYQFSSALDCSADQFNTVQFSTAQYSTVQCCTVKYRSVLYCKVR